MEFDAVSRLTPPEEREDASQTLFDNRKDRRMAETRTGRLVSLDAYRGLIMLTLAGNGFGLLEYARQQLQQHPESILWKTVGYHTSHPEWQSQWGWIGVSYWDLIQPSFMFMVGVAMAYSYAKRASRGDSFGQMFRHALFRSIVLILLGLFLESLGKTRTHWSFVCVLSQIGLGYLFVFLLMGRPTWAQLFTGAIILVGYWAWFVATPVPNAGPWENFAAHFQKNQNAAAYFDRWFLNLFPREQPFEANPGGYTTLNFVPSIVTMLLGLMSGELLQSTRRDSSKVLILVCGGAALVSLGVTLHETGLCPNVKRIWTPSWTLFSGGYTMWILAGFYFIIDVVGWRTWSMPLVILGVNSILLYLMGMMLRPWTLQQLRIHFGQDLFVNSPWRPILEASAVMMVFWLLCWWLYRQRLFIRI